jgi:DNA-binding protein HU-beta
MNKTEFITSVSKDAGVTKEVAKRVLEASLAVITSSVAKGEKVEFVGFGSFSRKLQKGREGKIPGTDKAYKTEDKNVPSFKAGKQFKDSVQAGK